MVRDDFFGVVNFDPNRFHFTERLDFHWLRYTKELVSGDWNCKMKYVHGYIVLYCTVLKQNINHWDL